MVPFPEDRSFILYLERRESKNELATIDDILTWLFAFQGR